MQRDPSDWYDRMSIHESWSFPILSFSGFLTLRSMLPLQCMLMKKEEPRINIESRLGMDGLRLYWQSSRCQDRKRSITNLFSAIALSIKMFFYMSRVQTSISRHDLCD